MPDENIYDVSQSDGSLNENPTGSTFNNEAAVVQGPTGDDDENKLWKAWMMEMLINDGDISTTTMNGSEQGLQKVPVHQHYTLKPCGTISYATTNGEAKGGQRI